MWWQAAPAPILLLAGAAYHAGMVEYGQGVSQGAGSFAGSQGGGGGAVDAGGNIGSVVGGFVNDTANTISGLPPLVVALGAVVLVVAALMVLRRAF